MKIKKEIKQREEVETKKGKVISLFCLIVNYF